MSYHDTHLVNILVDAAWDDLEQQYLNGDGEVYVDAGANIVEGEPDMPRLVRSILTALRSEEGE